MNKRRARCVGLADEAWRPCASRKRAGSRAAVWPSRSRAACEPLTRHRTASPSAATGPPNNGVRQSVAGVAAMPRARPRRLAKSSPLAGRPAFGIPTELSRSRLIHAPHLGHYRAITHDECRTSRVRYKRVRMIQCPASGRNARDLPCWSCKFDSRHPVARRQRRASRSNISRSGEPPIHPSAGRRSPASANACPAPGPASTIRRGTRAAT